LLKNALKLAERTDRAREGRLHVLHSLQERIEVRTFRRRSPTGQANPNRIQAPTQSCHQVVDRFQSHRRFGLMESRANGLAGEQWQEQGPQQAGRDSVSGQDILQEDRERPATTTTLATIGAEDTLTAHRARLGLGGIVAVEPTVPIQRLSSTTMGTAQLLKRKRKPLSASR